MCNHKKLIFGCADCYAKAHTKEKKWECPRCGKLNPYTRMICRADEDRKTLTRAVKMKVCGYDRRK